jgi:hypothetical protein
MPIDFDRIDNNGWRQGSVFTVKESRSLLAKYGSRPHPHEISVPEDSRLIVTSHSCDIVSRRSHEILVEVCPALPLPTGEGRGAYGFARDARRLRIPMTIANQPVLFDLHAPLRFVIARDELEECKPDPDAVVGEDDIDDLSFWLAARYRRRVFPNAFDKRLNTDNGKRIRRALKKCTPS